MLKRIGTRRLMVQDKDREITFQSQLGTKQMQLGEINLLLVNVYLVWLAGNKTTNIKTGEHLSTPFPRLNLTPSLQISVPCPCYHHELHTVPSVRQRMWKGWVMVSTQQFLSAATSFLHFCSTPEWTLHRPVFFLEYPSVPAEGLPQATVDILFCHGAASSPTPLTLVLSLMFITLSSNPTSFLAFSALSWMCFHRWHWLGWQAQLCPAVGPFWSQMTLAWGIPWSCPREVTPQLPPCPHTWFYICDVIIQMAA